MEGGRGRAASLRDSGSGIMASMLQVSDLNNQAVSAGKKLVHERRFLSHVSGTIFFSLPWLQSRLYTLMI